MEFDPTNLEHIAVVAVASVVFIASVVGTRIYQYNRDIKKCIAFAEAAETKSVLEE